MGFGIDPEKILVLYNGLDRAAEPVPPPRAARVVSVGRIDPLKDVHTMLRVAAEALRSVPHASFLHYGPMSDAEEAYGRSCLAMHEQLGLGDRFRFMGRTTDPIGVIREADVVLMTSISEGLPMSILEAMSQARPVISTGVGGVPDVVKGCGAVMTPGDDHGLAMAIVTLLRNPALAWRLGKIGHDRLERIFSGAACVDGYRELLGSVAGARGRIGPRSGCSRDRRARPAGGAADRRGAARPPAAGHARGGRRAGGVGRGARAARPRHRARGDARRAGRAGAEHRRAAARRDEQRGVVVEALTFPLTVIAIAGWAAPLADHAGRGRGRARDPDRAAAHARRCSGGSAAAGSSREHGPELLGRHRPALLLAASRSSAAAGARSAAPA